MPTNQPTNPPQPTNPSPPTNPPPPENPTPPTNPRPNQQGGDVEINVSEPGSGQEGAEG